MRRLAPALLLVLLALPPAASAATLQIIRGAGFGHGVGMSQYGAYGFARHGYDYRRILAHYYRGTDLSRTGTHYIRVLLQTGNGSATFTGATSGGGHKLDPTKTYKVKLNGLSGELLLDPKGRQLGHYDVPLDIASRIAPLRLNGNALNGVTAGHYHGLLEFRPSPFSGLAVVNVVALDQYLKGVVPGEMPSYWAPAALKAQAVAARSYALATDAGGPVFDQFPDTRSQVYRGADAETVATNAAVDATANQVLRYRGTIVSAYFFSTSGGHTENVQNVFYGMTPEPYLVGVKDPYDNLSPKHRWQITLSTRALQAKLGSLVMGKLRGIKVLQRGVSPRIVWAAVVGTQGSVRVRGTTLRRKLGLFDTWASFTRFTTDGQPGVPVGGPPSPGGGQPATRDNVFRLPAQTGRPARLYGSVAPAPRQRLGAVQLLGPDGRWRSVGRVWLSPRGAYSVTVSEPGTYRIEVGSLDGPSLQVR